MIMNTLQEFTPSLVHWSVGLTVLVGVTASEFSGAITLMALPITATSLTLSALSGPTATEAIFKKHRRLGDILDFFAIWAEILELLAASATCARVASATVDYITNERLREWFLGLQSHSLGEPWPDVLGVSIIIVISGLFMLGLEKSSSFSALLLSAILATLVFFVAVGSRHAVVRLTVWREDFQRCSIQAVLTAAAGFSYGFVNTLPRMEKHRALKVSGMVLIPLSLYSVTIVIFTLMSRYKELSSTATPLIRVFELRDVDWARLVMAICIICIVCLALTEILPTLYGLFVTLASKEWQIFLTYLQYKNSLTGAPLLAIFAAGSLAAIMAFACPLEHLIKILNATTLLKCVIKSLLVLHRLYKPEFRNESYLVSSSTQYSKLKRSRKDKEVFPKNLSGIISGWKNGGNHRRKRDSSKPGTTQQDDEYLLLNDYCDKSVDIILNDDSSDDNDEKESVLSSDVEDSGSSTDVDAVVQEYKDKIHIATIDNFNENKFPTYVTATTVIIFLVIIAVTTVFLSQVVVWRLYNLLWPCFTVLFFSTMIILVMPKNVCEDGLLPRCIMPLCAMLSLQFSTILVATILKDIWPGFVFWFCVGCLLFWRCECCTCDGLMGNNQKSKLNITENLAQYPDKYVDTILIAR